MAPSTSALPTHPQTGTSHTPSYWHFPHSLTLALLIHPHMALPTYPHLALPTHPHMALPTHPHMALPTPSHWHFPTWHFSHTLTLALPKNPHTGHLPHSLTSSYLVGGIGEVAEQLGAVRWGVGDGVPLQVELLQAGQWGEILHLCYLRRDVCHYWVLNNWEIIAVMPHALNAYCPPTHTHTYPAGAIYPSLTSEMLLLLRSRNCREKDFCIPA